MNETKILLNKAIATSEFEDWVEYKNMRNTTNKNIIKAKKQYTTDQLTKSRDKWRTIKI